MMKALFITEMESTVAVFNRQASSDNCRLKLSETLDFFNFLACAELIGAFRSGAFRRNMTLNLASDQSYARKLAELRQRFIYRSTRHAPPGQAQRATAYGGDLLCGRKRGEESVGLPPRPFSDPRLRANRSRFTDRSSISRRSDEVT